MAAEHKAGMPSGGQRQGTAMCASSGGQRQGYSHVRRAAAQCPATRISSLDLPPFGSFGGSKTSASPSTRICPSARIFRFRTRFPPPARRIGSAYSCSRDYP